MADKKMASKTSDYFAYSLLFLAFSIVVLHYRAMPTEAVEESRIPPSPEMPSMIMATDVAEKPSQKTPVDTAAQNELMLRFQTALLEAGLLRLKNVNDYTATFSKREAIDGFLSDEQIMELKLRHQPFSVYMKWTKGDAGRELLYQEGMNEGKMLVQLGGTLGRFMPTLKLDPKGDRAMAESRYPVTTSGLMNIAQKIVDVRKTELNKKMDVKCQMKPKVMFDKKPCYYFITEYTNPKDSKDYRRTELYIDEENCLPVCLRNYTWKPEDQDLTEDETLIEEYAFTNIVINKKLANQHFDKTNNEYSFR